MALEINFQMMILSAGQEGFPFNRFHGAKLCPNITRHEQDTNACLPKFLSNVWCNLVSGKAGGFGALRGPKHPTPRGFRAGKVEVLNLIKLCMFYVKYILNNLIIKIYLFIQRKYRRTS